MVNDLLQSILRYLVNMLGYAQTTTTIEIENGVQFAQLIACLFNFSYITILIFYTYLQANKNSTLCLRLLQTLLTIVHNYQLMLHTL